MSNAEYIEAHLTDADIDREIAGVTRELSGILDRHTVGYDAAVEDLRDLFNARRVRKVRGEWSL